ncbi:hypothetical protein [Thermococcus sp.]
MRFSEVKRFKGRLILAGLLVFLSIAPGPYYIRWIAVVLLAVSLASIMLSEDVKFPYKLSESEETFERKSDFERILNAVKGLKKSRSRKLIEEELLEIEYILLGGERNFRELRSNPPPALKAFYSSPDPYEGLKKALKILEDELDEGRGSPREV